MGFKDDRFPLLLATKSGSRKRKKVNGYKGDVKGEYNIKISKTVKLWKSSLQKKNNYNKNQEKRNFQFTEKNYCRP